MPTAVHALGGRCAWESQEKARSCPATACGSRSGFLRVVVVLLP